MNRPRCPLCGYWPRDSLVRLGPDREVCRPCKQLVRLGVRMVRKHGFDKVRDIVYELAEQRSRDHAELDPLADGEVEESAEALIRSIEDTEALLRAIADQE